jgi:beta-glucosidase
MTPKLKLVVILLLLSVLTWAQAASRGTLGFMKVQLNAGETRLVSLTLDRRAFSYYDIGKRGWTAEAGDFNIYVGHSAAQIDLSGKMTLQTP